MELKALRAAHRRIDLGGLVALPVLYFALMALGLFLFVPHYVGFSLLLVLMLLLQRPRVKSGQKPAARSERPRAPLPREVVDEADECFLRSARLVAVAGAAGYFLFLAGLDVDLRMAVAGARDPAVVLVAAAAGFAIAAAGRERALRSSWKSFAEHYPQIWSQPMDLNNGRTTRNAAAYLEWRDCVGESPGPT